jgi:hypothetical protein
MMVELAFSTVRSCAREVLDRDFEGGLAATCERSGRCRPLRWSRSDSRSCGSRDHRSSPANWLVLRICLSNRAEGA